MRKTTFRVLDMHCPSCAMTLEGLEDEVDGIRRVAASYHKQMMDVEYDESIVTIPKIVQAANDLGYTLVPL